MSRKKMEVLFHFLAERFERKSVVIPSNLVFSQWDQMLKDPMTTTAAGIRFMASINRRPWHFLIAIEENIPGDLYSNNNVPEIKL